MTDMTPSLWEHWLSCHTPLRFCARCSRARRIIRQASGRACPLLRVTQAKHG